MDIHANDESSRVPAELQAALIRKLNKETNLSLILTELVERTSAILKASACTIFTIDESGNRATQRAGSGYQQDFNGKQHVMVVAANKVPERPDSGQELGLTSWILSTGKPFLAETADDFAHHPHHSGRFDTIQLPGEYLQIQTFLGVPIRGLRGEIIGVIKAERRLPADQGGKMLTFSVDDELVLETIARVASRFLTYLTMAQLGLEDDAITSWARDVIAETAATEGELDTFLDLAAKITAAAMRADSCGIFLKDESGKTLTQRAGIGSLALRRVIRAYPWPDESLIATCKDPTVCSPPNCTCPQQLEIKKRIGLTAWIAATGKSFHARNHKEMAAHCHHLGQFDEWNFPEQQTMIGAFLGIPLHVGGRIIGVVKVENTSKKGSENLSDFTVEAKQRFELLAQDIALSIQRLQKQIPSRYRIIQEAQDTILEILRGGLDLPILVEKVVTDTRKLFHAGACALFLKEGNKLVQRAASGWAERGTGMRSYDLVPPEQIKENPTKPAEKVGLTVWIASRQEKFTARSSTELTMHPHHRGTFDADNFKIGERCESFMGFPMVIKQHGRNELVGVLKVETKRKLVGSVEEITYFSELDEIVFELIARSAAIAIQNTRLQKEATEATHNAAWREFSAMAAHRIGTEAVIIGGAIRWLKQGLSATAAFSIADPYLRRVSEALSRTDNFVQEFAQFTKPLELKPERLNINDLCRQAQSNFTSEEDVQKNHFELRLTTDIPDIWGDREKLLYVFKEICQNAIKAMQENGGILTISTMAVDHEGVVRIEFKDTGPGVKPSLKEKIFETGFKDRPGGTGLGLAIVSSTVRQHKGTVREIGEFGKGACFVINLPVQMPDGAKELILIVEDRDPVREDLDRIVKWDAPGRQVVTARNEMEAAEYIKRLAFDVVVTDINLEEGGGTATGGLEVVKAALAKNQHIPVIVVTAYGNMRVQIDDANGSPLISVEEKAKRMGCYAFIPRPHPTKDYLDLVKESVTSALTHGAIK